MNALILHPTAAFAVPVTHCPPRKAKGSKGRKVPNREDLAQMCRARGLKVTTKHTKGELMAMFAVGVQIRPAALDRENARRKAKKQQA